MLHYTVVDGCCKHITEEYCKHHSLGITCVHHADNNSYGTNEEAVDPV